MHKNRNPQICSIYSFPAPTSRFFSFEPTASLLPRRLYTFQPLTVSTAPVVETALSARLKNGNWPLTPATSIQVASSSSNPYHLMRTWSTISPSRESVRLASTLSEMIGGSALTRPSGSVASTGASPMARLRSETWNTRWMRAESGSCRR